MRLPLLILVVSLTSGSAHAADRGDEVFVTPAEDLEMVSARRQAQATLDSFFDVEQKKPSGTSGFKLKVKITEGKYSEHFWVQPFRRIGTKFEGVLANEPKYVHSVKHGQVISFGREDISDWGYVKDGKQIGSFTVCALFKTAPKEQVEYYRKNYGFEC